MSQREKQLQQALRWVLQYIDAIPAEASAIIDTVAMPGFDRDYVDSLAMGLPTSEDDKPVGVMTFDENQRIRRALDAHPIPLIVMPFQPERPAHVPLTLAELIERLPKIDDQG